MRRRLFLFAVILTGAVFLFTGLFPDIFINRNAVPDEGPTSHEGIILFVKVREKGCILSILDPGGFKVRGILYEEMEDPRVLAGKRITYRSELTYGDPARNPHCFDYRKYIRSSDHFLSGNISSVTVTGEDTGLILKYASFLSGLRYSFEKSLPLSTKSMMIGMLFGDTDGIDEDIKEDFRKNGTAHIMAVSGLHIGLLYSLYEKLNKNRISISGSVFLAFLLYTYGVLTMWSPSVIRAELMILMKDIAKIRKLRYDSLTSMSLAATLLIINNPYVIYSAAFQMSFLAIISINVVSEKLPEKLPGSLRQTLSVNLSMIAYQAYVFNFISPFAALINIPVIYAAGIAIPLSFLTFTAFALTYVLGRGLMIPVIIIPASSVTEMLVRLNSFLTLGGRSATDVISPPTEAVMLVLCLLLFLCSEYANILDLRKNRRNTAVIIILIAVFSFTAGMIVYEPMTGDEIVFVDVGQGACTHIRADGTNILIDGGGKYDRNIGEKVLKPYLLKNGVRHIDLSLATHEDSDHIKGLYELEECFRADRPLTNLTAGKIYRPADDVTVEVLWPVELSGDKQGNEESSVFMIDYRDVRVLVTGDLDMNGEKEMIAYYRSSGLEYKLKADVLNVGHHGSNGSTSEELLQTVDPDIAVIQVGRNSYGHPGEDLIRRLNDHGIKIFRNDTMGAVGLDLREKRGIAYLKAVHVMIDN